MSKSNYEAVKAWRIKNPDKRREQGRRYAAKYRDKMVARARKWDEENPERARIHRVNASAAHRKKYPEKERLSKIVQREKRIKIQDMIAGRPRPSCCEICDGNGAGCHPHHRIVFDHCHESGFFRGWLCDRCNKVLGLAKDDPSLLCKLAKYLEKNNVEIDHKRKKQITF